MNLISISLHVCAVSNAALTHQFALFMFCRCKCGNCSVLLLQNISERYCCSELEGCLESTKTDLVLLDIGADVILKCVTQHPGFDVPGAGNCFQKTRYPAVRNFDQFSPNSSFNSSKNIRYLFRNLKRL